MKTIRNPAQQRLFDPFEGVIGAAGQRIIAEGWQSLFREVVLEVMPVDKISEGMSSSLGRPSVELHAICGLLLIRDFQGWTVPEAYEALLFRSDIQYALNLEPGFEICQRTLERYLAKVHADEQISEAMFEDVRDRLIQAMEFKVKMQRLDSTHVLSDMSNISRARMIGLALKRFFRHLDRHDPTLLANLSDELLARYRKASDAQVFGDAKTSEKRQLALQQAAEDLRAIIVNFENHKVVSKWQDFRELQLIFSQQCELREEFVEVRKKTGGHVIQNNSDPDATYCGKKGPGYQVQVAETFNEEGLPNLITGAIVETAAQSDAAAVAPMLDNLNKGNVLPEEMTADSNYGSDENLELASQSGVTLVAPVPGGKKFDPDEVGYDQFEINDANIVVTCPAGHTPRSSSYNANDNRATASMDPKLCMECPLLNHCHVRRNKDTGKPTGRVQFRLDAPRAARRRRIEQTDEFRDRYRWRAGIEATFSCLKRTTGLKRLRVRGFKAVKASVLLKLAGLNLLRAVAMRALRRREDENAVISA